jgi:hypothetical protein
VDRGRAGSERLPGGLEQGWVCLSTLIPARKERKINTRSLIQKNMPRPSLMCLREKETKKDLEVKEKEGRVLEGA